MNVHQQLRNFHINLNVLILAIKILPPKNRIYGGNACRNRQMNGNGMLAATQPTYKKGDSLITIATKSLFIRAHRQQLTRIKPLTTSEFSSPLNRL
jgi:hypothetical protein